MLPHVSVGIVTYNSADQIGRCLASVLAQSLPPAGVVVWDNASSDGSADLARAAGAAVDASPVNVGFAAAATRAPAALSMPRSTMRPAPAAVNSGGRPSPTRPD